MINVLYSCNLCGVFKATVEVNWRRPDQCILDWTENVLTPALVADHERRSPMCHPETLSEVYIPMEGREYIGAPVKN